MMPPKQKKSGGTLLIVLGAIVAVVIALVICFFTVHFWEDATCSSAKTCVLCGKTEGKKLSHEWLEATCTTPETCKHCGKTEGQKRTHEWLEATCSTPETCKYCGLTQGEPVHTWLPATCEAPETCSGCRRTQGSALGHDWADATYDDPKTCTRCGKTDGMPKGYLDSVDGEFKPFSWGNMNTYAYYLESTVYGCKSFLLYFEPTYSNDTRSNEWKLLYQDANGAWHEHCIFTAAPAAGEYEFTFDTRPDIKAVAVIPCTPCYYNFALAVWSVYSSN